MADLDHAVDPGAVGCGVFEGCEVDDDIGPVGQSPQAPAARAGPDKIHLGMQIRMRADVDTADGVAQGQQLTGQRPPDRAGDSGNQNPHRTSEHPAPTIGRAGRRVQRFL